MKKINLSIVSYVNTLPYIYGLEQSSIINDITISKDTPAECARKIISGDADIGLVPIVLKKHDSNLKIISDFCIGSKNKVDSVCLMSQKPLQGIESIILDYQSRTSINLVKILCKYYWNITPSFVDAKIGFENNLKESDSAVIIGNRCFDIKQNYTYVYDLAEEWNKFTKLPFVFAGWMTKRDIPQSFISGLNEALQNGINNIEKVAEDNKEQYPNIDLQKYLNNNIAYKFDGELVSGMDLFLKYYSEIRSVETK